MRVLAVDFGLKRIGLALSDPNGRLALPYKTLVKKNNSQLMAQLKHIVDTEQVECLVVGLPLNLEGEETLSSRQAKNFARRLEIVASVPVHLQDETLTSSEASRRLGDSGLCGRRQKPVLDQMAAVIILESFLSSVRDGML
ncbi:MAG: Holliday junction resolvase RuvX [Desulfovermiculus sp.]